jgi:hypothetical protein
MKTKLFIYLSISLLYSNVYSQTPSENLNKYWNYRNRLKTKFLVSKNQWSMDAGRNGGINIPANAYNPTDIESPLVETSGTAKSVKWGDATCSLGYYIAVLATEYRLLNNYGQDVIPTLTELVYALHAIERLDWHAEGLYGCGNCQEGYIYNNQFIYFPYTSQYGACLNGFFIRDDVSSDFTTYWAGKGYANFTNMIVHSDFQSPNDAEESEDQVWNLLVGLALVKDLVDYSGNMTDGDGESVTFKKCAQKITHRLINYMMNTNGGWNIKNPCTGNYTHRGGIPTDLLPNAYYFAEAGNWITDKQFGDYHQGWNPQYFFPLPYGLSLGLDPFFYNDNAKLALSTISGISWASSYDVEVFWINQCSVWYNKDLPDNTNDAKLFAYEHFPLLNIILHNLKPNHYYYYYFMSFVEKLLDLAPYDGPFRYIYDINGDGKYDGNDYPVREWSTSHRLTKPIGISLTKDEDAGEYNGIDYMLLHNLYWLVYLENLNSDKQITDNFPYNYVGISNTTGTFGEQADNTTLNISTLQNISASNTLKSNTKVVYRAGKSITLNSGFKTETGVMFTATVDQHAGLVYKNTFQSQRATNSEDFTKSPFITDFSIKKDTNRTKKIILKVYPNPTKGNLYINISDYNMSDKASVIITNIEGSIILNKLLFETNNIIDLTNQAKGMYMITIQYQEQIIREKILVID